MGVLSIFVNIVDENVLYYGENGSSRLQKGLNYKRNTETRFLRLFWTLKNQKFSFYQLKSVHELIEDPLKYWIRSNEKKTQFIQTTGD